MMRVHAQDCRRGALATAWDGPLSARRPGSYPFGHPLPATRRCGADRGGPSARKSAASENHAENSAWSDQGRMKKPPRRKGLGGQAASQETTLRGIGTIAHELGEKNEPPGMLGSVQRLWSPSGSSATGGRSQTIEHGRIGSITLVGGLTAREVMGHSVMRSQKKRAAGCINGRSDAPRRLWPANGAERGSSG